MEKGKLLRPAQRELESAERAIVRMKESSTLEEFEDEWRIFLGAIEKCWVKAERVCQPIRNKFEPWQGRYKKLRKSDPLLKYLYHARHSDQHSVQEMIEPKSAQQFMTIGGKGDYVHIEHFSIDGSGRISSYQGSHPIVYHFLPERVELLRVLSSKKWYDPPRQHLGIELPWSAPIEVASLGLAFYQDFIKSIELEFCEN
ncbi:hypothetical protein [Vibrio sp. CJQ_6]|uniref:hypothetical protein n=1 Tax=Vibrio sp. CJQ_6 TaxID=3367165 RepID=UPI00370B3038